MRGAATTSLILIVAFWMTGRSPVSVEMMEPVRLLWKKDSERP